MERFNVENQCNAQKEFKADLSDINVLSCSRSARKARLLDWIVGRSNQMRVESSRSQMDWQADRTSLRDPDVLVCSPNSKEY